MRALLQYIYRFRGQFCLLCLVCLYLLATDVIPRAVWAIDRESPYGFFDVSIGPGYPGQLVDVSAKIRERERGRSCGVIMNPQVIGENGALAFVNQTRLVAGQSLQMMQRDANGNILFKTNLQVPPTIKPGMSTVVVPLQIICDDNETHTSRPIKVTLTAPWKITPKPENAPMTGCPSK